jgi:hypothetical protein
MSNRWLASARLIRLYPAAVILLSIVGVVTFKLYLIEGRQGPHVFGDELLYRLYAQRIHDWASYDLALHWIEPAYPPLYPMLLSFGLYATDWYHGMLVSNILAMVAAPILIYAITRWFAGRPASTAAAVVASVVPSGTLPMFSLAAESLAVPAFLLAVWATLAPRPYSYVRALLSGCAIGAAYMVKFILLVFIPPLALGFFLMQFALTPHSSLHQRIVTTAIRCALVAAGFAIVIGAWLLYAHWSGLPPMNALGILIADYYPRPRSYDGLGFYFVLNLFAALLAVAPLLGLLAVYRPKNTIEWIYAIVVFVTMIVTVSFNAWLCWKSDHAFAGAASFDSARPLQFLQQRYMLYLTWLTLPIAFVAAERVASRGGSRRIVASLAAVSLAAMAVLILIGGRIWPAAPSLLNEMSPDIWSYMYAGYFLGYAPLSAIALAIVPASLILLRPLWVGWRGIATAAVTAVAVFGALDLMGEKALAPTQWPKIGHDMAMVLLEWGAEGDSALLVVNTDHNPAGTAFYAYTAMFWMAKPPVVVGGTVVPSTGGQLEVTHEWPKTRIGYWVKKKVPDIVPPFVVLLSSGSPPPQARVLAETDDTGKPFYLIRIPPEQSRIAK